jgi:hypothetical protein
MLILGYIIIILWILSIIVMILSFIGIRKYGYSHKK